MSRHRPALTRIAPRLLALGLTLLPAAPVAPLAQAQSLPGRVQPLVLVTQRVDGPTPDGRPPRSEVQVQVGRPGAVRRGTTMTVAEPAGAVRDGHALGIGGLPTLDYGGGRLPRDMIARTANDLVRGALPTLRRQLDAALASTGAQAALFTFTQAVQPRDGATVARPFVLTFLLMRDRRGLEARGTLRVRSDQPLLLHATYTPLRATADVPAALVPPGGGTLALRLVDGQLQTVRELPARDVGGAFDGPDEVDGAAVDPEARVRCLADARHAGCAGVPVDLRTLLEETGADAAVLDYRTRTALATVAEAAAAPDGTPIQLLVPRVGVRVTSRVLTAGSCRPGPGGSGAARYRNTGELGVLLRTEAWRYLVTPEAASSGVGATAPLLRPVRIDAVRSEALADVQRYDKERPVEAPEVAAIDGLVIDPLGEGVTLVATRDVPGLTGVSPVQHVPAAGVGVVLAVETAGTPLLPNEVGRWPVAARWRNVIVCTPAGTLQFTAIPVVAPTKPTSTGTLGNDPPDTDPIDRPIGALEWRDACLRAGAC